MLVCTCNNYEFAEVFNKTFHEARKQHKCSECGCPINPGERYEYIFMVFEGESTQFHTCGLCAKIAETFQVCGRVPGVLWEDIHEANCGSDFCVCPESGR